MLTTKQKYQNDWGIFKDEDFIKHMLAALTGKYSAKISSFDMFY